MSNKAKVPTTNQKGKPALTPKLRFPEFRAAEGWEEKRLGNEGEFLSSLTGKAGEDFDAGEARFVTYMNVFLNTFVDPKALRLVDVKEGENQNAVLSGDVFFTISSETPEEVGMSSVLLDEIDNCYLNSFCALFRFSKSKRPNLFFTGYLLRQPLVRSYFTKHAQGSTRFNLSKDAFKNLPVFVPAPAEQQKIADCLTSVDELIDAQARKVDALKIHKKGLMQQLFPREGETQPRLRFPDFQDAGEWEEKRLGDVAPLQRGFDLPSDLVRPGRIPVVYSNGIQKFHEVGMATAPGLVTGRSGTIGKLHFIEEGEYWPHNTSLWVTDFMGNIPRFIYYLYDSIGMSRFSSGSGVPTLNRNDVHAFSSPVPQSRAEQQWIAACLTSIDDLIADQTQKLDALKTHKKGLMQQLFPSAEEVDA